ncbi:YebO family protein [Pantoea sp. MBD-2R]|uniref:YebO family protein n=1 Tax=unclassified Pantoea TaxID=2630326 RepID=UPI0011BF1082|nr:YebO family protein [Pantoea sp. CCBC3-3-1]
MNELASGAMGMASLGFIVGLIIVGLLAWFFINRASVRANEQVRLLEALLEEQKRQNALLMRLAEAVAGKEKTASDEEGSKDFTRLIPER